MIAKEEFEARRETLRRSMRATLVTVILLLTLIVLAFVAFSGVERASSAQLQPPPLRVLVVTGGHDHEPSFYSLFDGQTDMRAVVNPHPVAFRKNLVRDFDIIALYDMVQELPEDQRRALVNYLESGGKGLFVIHHALVSYAGWRWWWEEVTGCRYLEKPEGERRASTYQHDVEMTISPVAQHPITQGVAPFRLVDETYGNMQFAEQIQVLMRTDAPTSDGPVLWIGPYRKARVVALQLGHGSEAHKNPAFRNLFRRCLLWAGNRL